METRKEIAAEKKRCGSHNCTQAVLCTYHDFTGMDEETNTYNNVTTFNNYYQLYARIYNRTDKNIRKMKYKKIILGVALALACFSSLNANALTETKVKKTETQAAAPNVYWTDGYGRVSYTTNSIISPVVKIALIRKRGGNNDYFTAFFND